MFVNKGIKKMCSTRTKNSSSVGLAKEKTPFFLFAKKVK